MRRGQEDLRQWLNTFIYSIKTNGELNTIAQKWTGDNLKPLPTF
jgi:polar amino acid transport system substrate-binding protein